MKITVIVCTYNRSQCLAAALNSLAASTLPNTFDWEVLVVDNNSRDQTAQVAQDFSQRFPRRFRYLFEPNQGLSHARNAGVKSASGDIIAFTDDDVIVEPSWLANLASPFEDSKWLGTAGRIRLSEEFLPPTWLAAHGQFDLGGAIVQFDDGDLQAEVTRAPFGANIAFRKSAFEKYGNFRTDLGRKGVSLIGREDTEFCERLMAAGEHICYLPSAVVNHPVHKERLTKKYFRAYWFAQGRSIARQTGQRLSIWNIPRHFLREIRRKLRWMSSRDGRWFLTPQGRFFFQAHCLQIAGEVLESYRQSAHRDIPPLASRTVIQQKREEAQ